MNNNACPNNLLNSVTSSPSAFETIQQKWDSFRSGYVVPHIIEEYSVRILNEDEYTSRIAVFDEDGLPLVTGVVDIYDELDHAVEALAFLARVAPEPHRNKSSDAELRALLEAYPAYTNEFSGAIPFIDLALVTTLLSAYINGVDLGLIYNGAQPTRKGKIGTSYDSANIPAALKLVKGYIDTAK